MKKAATLTVLITVLLSACASHERVIVREAPPAPRPTTVVVRYMPPPVHEEQGRIPGYGWNWVPGHWKWEGHNWLWVHGRWIERHVPPPPPVVVEEITVAPSPHHYWVPGHWYWRFEGDGGWVWVKGGWRS